MKCNPKDLVPLANKVPEASVKLSVLEYSRNKKYKLA